MKRVLFLASYYPNKFGNEGIFIKKHAAAIHKNKKLLMEVISIKDCTLDTDKSFYCESKGFEHIVYYNVNTKGFRLIKTLKRLFNLLSGLRQIIRKLEKPDIIHLNCVHPLGFVAVFLSLYWKKPLYLTEHSSIYIGNEFKKYTNNFSRLHYYITFYFSKKITAVSEYHKKEIIKNIPFCKNRISVIPNIVTEDFIFKEKTQIKRKLIHVSNLKDVKGLEDILYALKSLEIEGEIFNLDVVGGKLKDIEIYKNLVLNLKLSNQIKFHGEQSVKELGKFYTDSDLLIMNSEFETFGVVYIESISTGTPIISNITGVLNNEIIQPFVKSFIHGSAENIKIAIKEFYKNPILISKENSQLIKKEFSESIVSDKFVKLYD